MPPWPLRFVVVIETNDDTCPVTGTRRCGRFRPRVSEHLRMTTRTSGGFTPTVHSVAGVAVTSSWRFVMELSSLGVMDRRGTGREDATINGVAATLLAFGREPAARQGASALNALSNELLMRVLDELSHGLMLVTESGKVRLANQAALRAGPRSEPGGFEGGPLSPRHDRDRDGFAKALTAAALGRR